MLYFAYGSNMLGSRMKSRCPSAKAKFTAKLSKYELSFNKIGSDNTGKATIEHTGSNKDCVHGVVYDISAEDFEKLDMFEGVSGGHYQRNSIRVKDSSGNRVRVQVYIAVLVQEGLKPSKEYLGFLTKGARYFNIPDQYVQHIKTIAK